MYRLILVVAADAGKLQTLNAARVRAAHLRTHNHYRPRPYATRVRPKCGAAVSRGSGPPERDVAESPAVSGEPWFW
jgi:hypothetical protein